MLMIYISFFFCSSRRRHTRCALVTGVQTCALPIFAILMLARQPHRRLEIWRAHDLEHGTENLLAIARHVGGDMIEQGRADEETAFMPLQLEPTPIDHQFGALVDALLDQGFDPRLV